MCGRRRLRAQNAKGGTLNTVRGRKSASGSRSLKASHSARDRRNLSPVPERPLKPCGRPRCPNLVRSGNCLAHGGEDSRRIRQAASNRRHGSASSQGYGAEWRRQSKQFLLEHPLCECEEHKGKEDAPAANMVEHVIPHRGDPVLFWDQGNWQARTRSCGSRKTASRDGGFGNPRRS